MRVLCAAVPGQGLALQTVPLAWALRAAGHDVLVANTGATVTDLAAAGLPAVDVCPGRDVFGEFVAASRRFADAPPAEPPPARRGFAVFGHAMLDGLLDVAREFRPDLVVATLEQGAAPLVAAELGVPLAEQSIRLAWAGTDTVAEYHRAVTVERMESERRRLGLPEPGERAVTIDVRPPSLGGRAADDQWLMRYVPYNGSRPLPRWALRPAGRRRVCVTMGSCLALPGGPGSLPALLDALAEVDAEFVLALGDVDAAELGEPPPNMRFAGWMPLGELLASCSAIVHHGGAGTAFTALVHGVPQLVVPKGADRPENAAVVAESGAALVCDPKDLDPAVLRATLVRLLEEPGFTKAADAVRDEIAAQPPPPQIAERLTELPA